MAYLVDPDGEAVQIGNADKVSGWTYKNTVVQRNGLTIKTEGDGISDDEIAFRAVGGFGPWKRAYRPGGFAAYFIGTTKDKETFHAQLEKLVALYPGAGVSSRPQHASPALKLLQRTSAV